MLSLFALPAMICYILLYPISRFATFLSKGMLRIVGIRMVTAKDETEFSKVDLDYLVQSSIDSADADACTDSGTHTDPGTYAGS